MMMLNKATFHRLRSSAVLAACSAAALLAAPAVSAQSISAPLSVTTLAGVAGQRQATNGTTTAARFYAPAGIVVNAAGNLIVADTCNNIFRQVTPAGVVTTFAGTAIDPSINPHNIGSADGTGAAASFYIGEYASTGANWDPPIYTTVGSHTLGIDGAGNIYLADTMNDTIRMMTPTGVVTTLAGGVGSTGSVDSTSGRDARFWAPAGVAADSAGNVYVADSGNYAIRKVTPTGAVTTFAGTMRVYGDADGTGSAASFKYPAGIAIDSSGNLYVTDKIDNTIRKITPGGVVTTLAGRAGASGSADGSGSQARFNGPTGIAVDTNGNIYVADTGNNAIRMISASGTVTTIAGSAGTIGSTDGVGTAALFNQPYGVTVASNGTVYIADTQNNTIRTGVVASGSGSLQITGIPPAVVQVKTGTNVTLKVAATGSPSPTYQWSKNGTAIAGATTATLQLNSVATTDAANYSVLVASGLVTYASAPTQLQVYDPTSSGNYSATIVMQPASRTVAAGQSTIFSVEASSSGTLSYQWAKNGQPITGATASSYTIASAQATDAAAYTVTVTDGTTTLTTSNATLTVTGVGPATAPTITTQPLSITVDGNATATFTAGASGSPAPTFQWQKNGVTLSNGATVSGATSTTLTITNVSSSDAGNYTLVASNSAGTTVSNAATLTVAGGSGTPASTGHISNMSVLTSINAGETFTFGYFVGGSGTVGTKPILMRAMGPTLAVAPFNVGGTLSDPYMEFYNDSTLIASNDNWNGDASIRTAAASVGAFPFASDTSKDAAIYNPAVILSGGHSIKVSGVNGSSGTVIAELYDATPGDQFTTTTPRLTNVSLLKNVGATTTLGFYIAGAAPVKVLIRAVGPTLAAAPYNVGGAMGDPKMALFNQNDTSTAIATNDNWGGNPDVQAAFSATGAFSLDANSKDAAMVQTLQPGGYTVQVSPSTGATGVALIEVYEVAQ